MLSVFFHLNKHCYMTNSYIEQSLSTVINIAMIFAPSIGYIAQAIKFKIKKSSVGFSLCVCLVLIFSNILRIFFWFGKQFTTALLFQSFIVLLSQLYLIKVYLDYKEQDKAYVGYSFFGIIMKEMGQVSLFWKWNYFIPYLITTFLFSLILGGISYLFGFDNENYIEFIGYLSTGIEILLGIPQIIANYYGKNVQALSLIMFMTWILGDSFKTGYYIITKCPIQFIVFGVIQIIIDVTLIGQMIYYNKGSLLDMIKGEFSQEEGKMSVEEIKNQIENIVNSEEGPKDYGSIVESNSTKSEENVSLLSSEL